MSELCLFYLFFCFLLFCSIVDLKDGCALRIQMICTSIAHVMTMQSHTQTACRDTLELQIQAHNNTHAC